MSARSLPTVYRPEVPEAELPSIAVFISPSLTGSDDAVWFAFVDACRHLRRTSWFTKRFEYVSLARPGAEAAWADHVARFGRTVDLVERTGTISDLYATLAYAAGAVVIWDGEDRSGLLAMHELESRNIAHVVACLDPLTGQWHYLTRKAPWVPHLPPQPAGSVTGGKDRFEWLPCRASTGLHDPFCEPWAPCWPDEDPAHIEKATFYQPAGQDVIPMTEQLLNQRWFSDQASYEEADDEALADL